MGVAYLWFCKAIKLQDALGAYTWALLFCAYVTFYFCVIEHFLWKNGIL